jgi:hypothetical protein
MLKKGMSSSVRNPSPYSIRLPVMPLSIHHGDGSATKPGMPFFACDMLKKGMSGSGRNPSPYRIRLSVTPLSIQHRHLFKAEPDIPFFGPVQKLLW